MHVVIVASEVAPFSSSGVLGDRVAGLAAGLTACGCGVSVISPYYPREIQRGADMGVADLRPAAFQRGPKDVRVALGRCDLTGRVMLAQTSRGVRHYLLSNDTLFDRGGIYGPEGGSWDDNHLRFAFLSRAALEVVRRYRLHPDVIHCHDWPTALLPVYGEQDYGGFFPTVLTFHGTRHQGRFPKERLPELGLAWDFYTPDALEYWGDVNLLKGGLVFASRLTTVSPTYARDLLLGRVDADGLEGVLSLRGPDLNGVLCGVDDAVWDPAADPLLPRPFSADDLDGKAASRVALLTHFGLPPRQTGPVVAFVPLGERLDGWEFVPAAAERIVAAGATVLVESAEETGVRAAFEALRQAHPDRVGVRTRSTARELHLLYAGADIALAAGRYEPSGLVALRAQRYGAVPVVHAVGGLADAVTEGPEGDGFRFERWTEDELVDATRRAMGTYDDFHNWALLVGRCMKRDNSWRTVAIAFLKLYSELLAEA